MLALWTQERIKLASLAPNSLLFSCKEGVVRPIKFFPRFLAFFINLFGWFLYLSIFEGHALLYTNVTNVWSTMGATIRIPVIHWMHLKMKTDKDSLNAVGYQFLLVQKYPSKIFCSWEFRKSLRIFGTLWSGEDSKRPTILIPFRYSTWEEKGVLTCDEMNTFN